MLIGSLDMWILCCLAYSALFAVIYHDELVLENNFVRKGNKLKLSIFVRVWVKRVGGSVGLRRELNVYCILGKECGMSWNLKHTLVGENDV